MTEEKIESKKPSKNKSFSPGKRLAQLLAKILRSCLRQGCRNYERAGITKGGSITVPLTSCLTGLD